MPVLVTDAIASNNPALLYGPWEFSGSLFAIAFTVRASTAGENSELGIFKSTDDGDTWATVGTTLTLGDLATPFSLPVSYGEAASACETITFPSDPWVYVAHVNTSNALCVARLNLADEDWDATSVDGPDIVDGSVPGGSYVVRVMIEQSSAGAFGLLCNLIPTSELTDRAFTITLSEDLSTWSSRNEVASSDDCKIAGIARGTAGRIHGLVRVETAPDDFDVRHILVRQTGGTPGGTFNLVDDGAEIALFGQATGVLFGSEVFFIYAQQDNGVGGPFYSLATVRAASADVPSWTIDAVDPTSELSQFFFSALTTDGADLSVFWRGPGGSEIARQQWSGSAWGASSTVVSDAGAGIAARPRAGGYGIFYTLDGEDLWFERIGGAGGGDLAQAGRLDSNDELYPGTIATSVGGCSRGGAPVIPGPPVLPSACGAIGAAY